MFNLKKLFGFESIERNSRFDDELSQMIANIDMDFTITPEGALLRNPKDNLKNKYLIESFANAHKLITKRKTI